AGAIVLRIIDHAGIDVWGLAASSLLVQSWIPSSRYYYAINGVAWSLACEAFFYALFPFLIKRLIRLDPRQRKLLLLALFVLVISIPASIRTYQVNDGVSFWFIYIFPVTRLAEFVIGMLVALAVRNREDAPLGLLQIAGIAALAYVAAGFVPTYLLWTAVTVVPFALLIWAVAVHDLSGRPSWLSTPLLIRLGEWSFAFYLVHTFALSTVNGRLGLPYPVRIVVALVLSIALAAALYHWVEKPLERRLRGARGTGRGSGAERSPAAPGAEGSSALGSLPRVAASAASGNRQRVNETTHLMEDDRSGSG
ncbi:MAG: hypothetical protein QOJ69_1996, partial [Actinomycetota bacterium]|nr:hypothetical protein [Actinomycetota bacterium]